MSNDDASARSAGIAAIIAAHTPLAQHYAGVAKDMAQEQDAVDLEAENAALRAQLDQAHATFRQIRRWIESEDRPGEWTAEIYQAAGKALPY